ncbi:hypothetical protein B9479_007350 [Cryptococcus floricola]|uniref:Nucleoporin Nup188 N-terminal subdomain III domain-containing protein n=1 Tax=Cryptococcus floricola TaxID=2591691 RepID=A0A5D3ANZ9_9TREE|nr:hypothetical protein B9479_007350 [Cryptococcus floricola]
MVNQAPAVASLTTEDLLCPLTTIRDTLLRPDSDTISIPKLRALLARHKQRISTPWNAYEPRSNTAREAIKKATFTLPQTEVAFTVADNVRKIALEVSDLLDMNEYAAFLATRSYLDYSLDEETSEERIVDRVVLWVAEETLAVPQIALAVLKLSDDETPLGNLAYDVRVEAIGEPEKYIEGLFRGFSVLAQKEVDERKRKMDALFWATLQLRLQEILLNLLFVLVYQIPKRSAGISEGLIRGCVMSAFGTSQANGDIWEENSEAQAIALRIRDLMVVIAIESLCLGQIISPSDPLESLDLNTLIQSQKTIASVHDFLVEQSTDLEPHIPEAAPGTVPLPLWPMPIICLVWSMVLRSLDPAVAPSSTVDGATTWQGMAVRALRLPSGLFPWVETILSGSLFEGALQGTGGEEGAFYRKVFKDVLVGLTELVQLESIADRPGLYRSWELLFGGGSPSASSLSAADFWIADFQYEERRAVLDRSHFPYQPTNLPRTLAALTGQGESDVFGTDAASQVHHYFTNLPSITHAYEPAWCRGLGTEAGVEVVEAAHTLVLPGGESIPRGSKGVIIFENGSSQVMWVNQIISGWSLLLEILQAAAGLRPIDEKTQASADQLEDSVYLSVRDLDIQQPSTEILAAGLKLLRNILHATPYLKATFLTHLIPEEHMSSGQALLQLALTVLHQSRIAELAMDVGVVSDAVDVVEALITAPSSNVWPALRASGFFDASGKRKASVAGLVQAESVQGHHHLTTSLLRLVLTLVQNASHVPEADTVILTSALRLVFFDIWNNFLTWRYSDVAKKYELSSLVTAIFDTVLSHPLSPDSEKPTPAAQILIDLFISSTSPLTYRPLIEAVTQSNLLVPRLINSRRPADAELVVKCLDEAMSFLATLLRASFLIGSPSSALPKSLLALPVSSAALNKIQLVDSLFEIASTPMAQTSNVLSVLVTLRTYIEVTGGEAQRPSLASMLRSPSKTFGDIVEASQKSDDFDVKAATWHLLASIVSNQPGCVLSVLGHNENELTGPLKDAVAEVESWEEIFRDAPHLIAAVLNFIQSALRSAGADSAIGILRKNKQFWQNVFDLSTRIVPAPPSFALSLHSEDFVPRIKRYAYSVQAKANATSLLAAELAYAMNNDDEDEPETKARELVLSLFRNDLALQEAGLMACHTSCVPQLHEEQERKIKECGGNLNVLKTARVGCEREFGQSYLYDGVITVPESSSKQATANSALDLLNLNWSMLDADIALTRSFRLLTENIAAWAEGDALAMTAAIKASIAIAENVAEEYREGDIMLAIQVERLSILAVLLETALDPQEEHKPDTLLVQQLSTYIYSVINSHSFPPIISLRQPDLPAIHQPALRILFLLLQHLSSSESTASSVASREAIVDAGTVFALESADIVLDSIVRKVQLAFVPILSMVVGVICAISRLSTSANTWLDRVQGVNLVSRSLDVLVRARITDGQIPLHISSILLLHLALAGNPSSAEKLAVSGILPAYSDNAIIAEAEMGKIEAPSSQGNTVHDAWCGMLLVVKALLATLPDTASFTRTDIVPFLRVCSAQMQRAFAWNGETPLSIPALEEMELVVDIQYGVACALGPRSLDDYAVPALALLKGIRFAFSHPRLFSTLVVPSSEEEREKLEEELAVVEEKQDVDLLDVRRTPIIAGRATTLLRLLRTIILTLTVLTRSWEALRDAIESERIKDFILLPEDENASGTSSDPVGIINDIYVIVQNILERLPSLTPTLGGQYNMTPSASSTQQIRDIASQLLESTALVSYTQLSLRHALLSPEERGFETEEVGMDLDGESSTTKRRMSLSQGGSKEGMVIRELAGDLRGMLIGEGGMMGVLRNMADRAFGAEGEEP